MGAEGTILFRVEEGLAWITLNRPDAGNAINVELREALLARLAEIAGRTDIRAGVITAAGSSFCTGADLFGSPPDPDEMAHPGAPRAAMKRNSQRLIRTCLELEKPLIAAVNGVAAGMGAHLAFACDLVIAAAEARFVEVFVRRGLAVDAGGAYLLARMIGIHHAKELVFLGDSVSAADASRIGLCNKVVPGDQLMAAAAEWGTRLAKGPTFALGLSKRLLNRAHETGLDSCLEEEGLAQSLVAQSADLQEGMRAFAEKRKPEFRGR